MKFFKEEEAGKAGTGAPAAPDVAKLIENMQKGLSEDLKKLNKRVDQLATPPAPTPKAKVEDEEDLNDMILINPKKAVETITRKVEDKVRAGVNADAAAKDQFNNKFSELQADYPEIADQSSDLHVRAKEILAATQGATAWDSGALERAVLKAASEKGVSAVKHRKQSSSDDSDSNDYLGGGSGGSSSNNERRKSRSEKLPAATLAFAEAVGMNTKDPKVIERLTKTHNDRKANWSKYR